MTGAIIRVQTQASGLNAQVDDLRRDSASLVSELQRVDSTARAAAETLIRYRHEVEAGKTPERLGDVPGLKDVIIARAGVSGQAFVAAFERELGGGPPRVSPAQRAAAMAQPPRGPALPSSAVRPPTPGPGPVMPAQPMRAPAADQGPRALTPQERAAYLATGRYTPEQLDRARVLKPGTLLVPGPIFRSTVDSPAGGSGIDGSAQTIQPPQPQGPARRAGSPAGAEQGAADENTEALHRRDAAQRAFALTERGLRVEWQNTTKALREQAGELDKTEATYRRLRQIEAERGKLSDRDALRLGELPARVQDLRAGYGALRTEREALATEAQRRGYEVVGDRLFGPGGPGPIRQGIGAFLAGGGIGAGSPGGTAAGILLGRMRPGLGLPLLAGALTVGTINRGREAYGTYIAGLQEAERTGRVTGGSGMDILDDAAQGSRRYRTLSYTDLAAARGVLARGVGRTDFPGLPAMASVTGRSAVEMAGGIVGPSRVAPRIDPTMSARLLAEFGASGAPEHPHREELEILQNALANTTDAARRVTLQGMIRDRQRGLGYSTALAPQFESSVLQVARGAAGPLTRVPVEGIGAQIRAASRWRMPGIDMRGPQAIDVGAGIISGVSESIGRPVGSSGALDDIRMLAVMRLRGTPMAQRLKDKLDIDISTIPGALRAIERAPELAARGYPEIARGMLGAERGAFGNPTLHELALRATGTEGETAHLMATRPAEDLFGVRPMGQEPRIDAAAAAIANTPDVARLYEHIQRPELREFDLGQQMNDQVGLVVERNMNDLKDSVTRVLGDAATQLVDGVLGLLNREIDQPGGGPRQ